MLCPVCGEKELRLVPYEGVVTKRCDACEGCWVDAEALKAIINKRQIAFDAAARKSTAKRRSNPGIPGKDAQRTLKCPECHVAAEPRNYGADSGIIVNRCPNCLGVWLDRRELEAIQMLIEGIGDNFLA